MGAVQVAQALKAERVGNPGVDAGLLLLLVLLFALLGSAAGLGTGLLPGVHVNNVALLVLAAWPGIAGALAPLVAPEEAVLLAAAFLAAASVAHGIVGLLPSVFLGAPDSETALSVLPGHRLLSRGRGYEAVVLGARGAFFGTLVALPFLLPFRLLLGPPVGAYDRLRRVLPFLLLFLVALMIATEGRAAGPGRAARKRVGAVVLLLIAGALGWVVLRPGFLQSAWAPLAGGGDSRILFPLFTGLFGFPTLLLSARTRGHLPPQDLGMPEPLPTGRATRGLLAGTLAGASVSWFPGLGGSNATVVAQLFAGVEAREDDPNADREFLFAAGAAGAATTVFTFAALFVISRARSGVAAAVQALSDGGVGWDRVADVPALFAAILLAVVVAAALAYGSTVRLARPFAVLAGRIRYGRVAATVAGALAVAVFVATGPLGLLVLASAAALGLVPALVGIRRVHLMGCLLLPLLFGGL